MTLEYLTDKELQDQQRRIKLLAASGEYTCAQCVLVNAVAWVLDAHERICIAHDTGNKDEMMTALDLLEVTHDAMRACVQANDDMREGGDHASGTKH